MSLSSAHLKYALSSSVPLSPADVARFRKLWADAYVGQGQRAVILEPGVRLESIIDAAHAQFRRPHEQWQWSCRQPIPFCWGPQGPLMLLAGMLAAYAMAVLMVIHAT